MQYIDIPAGMETAAFAMGSGALNELADFVAKVFPGKKPWIIADENTFAAAGKRLQNSSPTSTRPTSSPVLPVCIRTVPSPICWQKRYPPSRR